MTPEEKKLCSEALIEAMEREELHTSEAARHLGISPAYLSMIKNPKLWDSCPKKAWDRVYDWMLTRDRIGSYVIPEGEDVYKAPEKKSSEAMVELTPKEEKAFVTAAKEKKSKPGKSTEISVEIANALSERIANLELQTGVLLKRLIDAENKINGLGDNFFVQQDGTISVMLARLNTIEKRLKETDRPSGIVIFQRNNYKP